MQWGFFASHAFRQRRARLRSGRRAQNHKLIPAKSRQKVVGPETFFQALRYELYQLVAGVMAERVIDILEAIDVEIASDGTIVVGRKQAILQEGIDSLDHVDAVW